MHKMSQCQMTTSDYAALQKLLRKSSDAAFLRLLRLKLATAIVVSTDDLSPDVATIGSRVDFTIDDLLVDSRFIRPESTATSLLSLPITAIRGLALLGLKTGNAIIIESPAGGTEKLQLHKVYRQSGKSENLGSSATYPSARAGAGSVLAFAGLQKPPLLRAMENAAESDDEDPGPFAA